MRKSTNPYNQTILFRRIEKHGWYIVGRQVASNNYAEFYVKVNGIACRRRHIAPIYVENNRCSKCVELGHHNVPIGEKLTIDTDPSRPVDIGRIVKFWRAKLDLPEYDDSLTSRQHHSIYVIDDIIYFNREHLDQDINITISTVNNRCANTRYEFAGYVRILCPGIAASHVYNVDGKTYTRQSDIAVAHNISQPIVHKRLNSPEWTTWHCVSK